MKIFLLICLAIGWASTEKLDRSYLPPPGSKFSGGSPGDIQVPLEFPKLNYSTGRPQVGDNVPNRELGINRRPLKAETVPGSTRKPDGFTYFQNSYSVPKTTTSYAFTQTTTFAPVDDYNGLGQNYGFLNTSSGVQQSGFPQNPQSSGQNYQRQQSIGGQSPSQGPSYNQYQPGQNLQSTLAPYVSTTQPPQLVNNRNRLAYLPPVPSPSDKGQVTSGQIPYEQDNAGYPYGQPQGPGYQDGLQFTSTTGPGFIEGVNQQNQFIENPTTIAPQYQDESYSPSTGIAVNQQRFGTRVPSQQNQQRFPEIPTFPSSTAAPQSFTTPEAFGQNRYTQKQKFPISTPATQYQYGERISTPGSSQQRFGSQLPNQQSQSNYSGPQNFPSSTAAPQYQNGQQFVSPGLVKQNQYSGSQSFPSTTTPQYQETQRYTTLGPMQEEFVTNQQRFGSQIPNQPTKNQYTGDKNLFSSTAVPQQQDGQFFTTSGSEQQKQQNLGDRKFPQSNMTTQYQNEQRYTTPGPIQQEFGALAPGQKSQNQNPGNQYSPSSTSATQITTGSPQPGFGYPEFGDQSQNQYQGSQYQNEQFTTPKLEEKNKYLGNKNTPSATAPAMPIDQRFTTPRAPLGFGSPLPNQQNYPGLQTTVQNYNQQYPSTVAPQYQSSFASTPGSNIGFEPNQQTFDQYAERPGYNQQPQMLVPESQPQDGNIQTLPGSSLSYPTVQGKPGIQTSPSSGNQPSSQTGSQFYSTTPPVPGYSNQAFVQNRPARPQAASDRTAEIINYDNLLTPEGYSYSYDTSNGIHADETGTVGDGTKAQGGYSYTGDDGKVYSVIYSADENGFQPRGDHLPTPPPIPEAIQRVIEQANIDKESGISDDGSYDEEKYGHMKYDGSLSSFRPQNKTISLVNGADIPNRYESRIGGQNINQLQNKGGKKPTYQEDGIAELEEINGQEQVDDESDNKENNIPISNKYPTADQKLKDEGVNFKEKIKNIAKTELSSNRRPNNRNGFNGRPDSTKIIQDSASDYVSGTDNSEDNDDFHGSSVLDDESDLINYRDDPNYRTDFHGINKYLPNSKGSNRLTPSENQRPFLRPDGTKRPTAMNKLKRPGNQNNQVNGETITENEEESGDKNRIRIPVRNKFTQEKFDSRQEVPTDSNEESNTYMTNNAKNNERFGSKDEFESGVYPFEQKVKGKLKRPTLNRRINISKNKNIQTVLDEKNGYEYTPPQRKFDSEVAINFPSRTAVTEKTQYPLQERVQTTIRPFMTPNVYGNDKGANKDDDDQYDTERKFYRPVRPMTAQKPIKSEVLKEDDQNNGKNYPETTANDKFDSTRKPSVLFGTTPSRQAFGRPQTTAMPNYEDQDTTRQDKYNINYQGQRRPGNKVIFGIDGPKTGVSESVSNSFVSTTPLPNLESKPFKEYNRPSQYMTTSTPNDSSNFKGIGQGNNTNAQKPSADELGITNSQGQVSTTYRPSYTFEDRTLAPSGPIAVDGFGRPISNTNRPVYDKTYSPTNAPVQGTRTPLVTDTRLENRPGKMGDKFRPSVGRFGVTSAPTQGTTTFYNGSTPGPIGEDFSGPKQPQRFDPDTGYHYK